MPLFRRLVLLSALLPAGCVFDANSQSFKEDYAVALKQALAWSGDARLAHADGTTLGIVGVSEPRPDTTWSFEFIAPSRPGRRYNMLIRAGRDNGASGGDLPFDLVTATEDDYVKSAAAIARWGFASDSPRWFTDSHWPGKYPRTGVATGPLNGFIALLLCHSGCVVDDESLLVVEPRQSQVAVELWPTYRVFDSTNLTDGAAALVDGGAD